MSSFAENLGNSADPSLIYFVHSRFLFLTIISHFGGLYDRLINKRIDLFSFHPYIGLLPNLRRSYIPCTNKSHTNSAPAIPSDLALVSEEEPTSPTEEVSMIIISSLVLGLMIFGMFSTVGVDVVSGMELEGEREVAVGDIAIDTDEELTSEDVGADKMLVEVVSVLFGRFKSGLLSRPYSSLRKKYVIIKRISLDRTVCWNKVNSTQFTPQALRQSKIGITLKW